MPVFPTCKMGIKCLNSQARLEDEMILTHVKHMSQPVSGIEGHSSNLVAWDSVDLHGRCDWPLK